jgi:hypothetical protein
MKSTRVTLAAIALISCAGCEVPELESPQAAVSTQPAQPAEPGLLEQAAHVDPESFLPDGRVDMRGVVGEPPMTTGVPREIHPKDPKQGKLSRKSGGGLGSTMQAMPWVKNETTFNLVIKPALVQYEIMHSGYPKNHQEFMEKFIPEMCPQVMPLPELEPGDEYLYDHEDNILKIWRPSEATPELLAKYKPEAAPAAAEPAAEPADQSAEPPLRPDPAAQPATEDAAAPVDPAESTEPEDVSIRGRAEALGDTRQDVPAE